MEIQFSPHCIQKKYICPLCACVMLCQDSTSCEIQRKDNDVKSKQVHCARITRGLNSKVLPCPIFTIKDDIHSTGYERQENEPVLKGLVITNFKATGFKWEISTLIITTRTYS